MTDEVINTANAGTTYPPDSLLVQVPMTNIACPGCGMKMWGDETADHQLTLRCSHDGKESHGVMVTPDEGGPAVPFRCIYGGLTFYAPQLTLALVPTAEQRRAQVREAEEPGAAELDPARVQRAGGGGVPVIPADSPEEAAAITSHTPEEIEQSGLVPVPIETLHADPENPRAVNEYVPVTEPWALDRGFPHPPAAQPDDAAGATVTDEPPRSSYFAVVALPQEGAAARVYYLNSPGPDDLEAYRREGATALHHLFLPVCTVCFGVVTGGLAQIGGDCPFCKAQRALADSLPQRTHDLLRRQPATDEPQPAVPPVDDFLYASPPRPPQPGLSREGLQISQSDERPQLTEELLTPRPLAIFVAGFGGQRARGAAEGDTVPAVVCPHCNAWYLSAAADGSRTCEKCGYHDDGQPGQQGGGAA